MRMKDFMTSRFDRVYFGEGERPFRLNPNADFG